MYSEEGKIAPQKAFFLKPNLQILETLSDEVPHLEICYL